MPGGLFLLINVWRILNMEQDLRIIMSRLFRFANNIKVHIEYVFALKYLNLYNNFLYNVVRYMV